MSLLHGFVSALLGFIYSACSFGFLIDRSVGRSVGRSKLSIAEEHTCVPGMGSRREPFLFFPRVACVRACTRGSIFFYRCMDWFGGVSLVTAWPAAVMLKRRKRCLSRILVSRAPDTHEPFTCTAECSRPDQPLAQGRKR